MTKRDNTEELAPWVEISENEYSEVGDLGLCEYGSIGEIVSGGDFYRFYQCSEVTCGLRTRTLAKRLRKGATDYFQTSRDAVIWHEARIENRPDPEHFATLAYEIRTQDKFERTTEAEAARLPEFQQAQIHALVEFAGDTFAQALARHEEVSLFSGTAKEYFESIVEARAGDLAKLFSEDEAEFLRFLAASSHGGDYSMWFGERHDEFYYQGKPYTVLDLPAPHATNNKGTSKC